MFSELISTTFLRTFINPDETCVSADTTMSTRVLDKHVFKADFRVAFSIAEKKVKALF